jgi:Tol biopolymer transport system component
VAVGLCACALACAPANPRAPAAPDSEPLAHAPGRALERSGVIPASTAASERLAITSAPGAAAPATPILAALVDALEVRNLTGSDGRSEAHPRFSPDGRLLSYELREGSAQSILLAQLDDLKAPPQRITSVPRGPGSRSVEDVLLGLEPGDESYNAELSFAPDSAWFVFTGNARSGVYRLYRGRVGASGVLLLTSQAKQDGHPAVSPDGRWLAYVSAREGPGKLVLRDLQSGAERQLTDGAEVDLYPVWSPDSRSIAYTSGTNDDHDVYLVRDVAAPGAAPIALTRWNFDDLRPVFSPDGSALAFYSNFSPDGDLQKWSILVVPADGSGPRKGEALGQRVVATQVVKDLEAGPAWLPWGHALVYARDRAAEWNPIFAVDTDTRKERPIATSTRMNHDLVCSRDGWLAFRAQVASWDDIFLARLVQMP